MSDRSATFSMTLNDLVLS